MRRATAALVLAAMLAIAAPAAAGASRGPSSVQVPRGMAAYEWHGAGDLPYAEVLRRMRFMRANGFNTVYLEVGDYLDAAELAPGTPGRWKRLEIIRRQMRQFVRLASSVGLAVHALSGGPTWTGELSYLGEKLVRIVGSYNAKVGAKERFQGVQLDLEPYTLPGWLDDAEDNLEEYLDTLAGIVKTYRSVLHWSDNGHLQLGFAIPFWFDAKGDAPGAVDFDHTRKPAVHHLIDMIGDLPGAYLVVMAYRDFTGTANGTIAHARDEFRYAAAVGARSGLVVGQQYGPASRAEQHITFHRQPRRQFLRAAAQITEAFRRYPQFRGLSVDDLDAYMAARP